MAENPESINALVHKQTGSNNDDAVEAMRRQVRIHDQTNENKTALDKVVEFVWHKDDQTLADLKELKARVDQGAKTGNNSELASLQGTIRQAVKADQDAMETQNSVDFYATSFMKAVPLFAGKSKVMMATSIGVNMMDAVHMKDSGGQVAADLALGGFKGFALKKTFDVLGGKEWSIGAEGTALQKVSAVGGVGLKGIVIGGASRLYDTGLNRQSWVNEKGNVDPLNAVSAAARAAFDGRSMAMDATLFMTAHGAFAGMAKLGTKAVEASPLLQKLESSSVGTFVKNSKMLPGSAMGATFGFSSGAVGEATREHQAGESFDLGKIFKRGAYQALTDGAAGATGAAATFMERNAAMMRQQQQASGRMGLAFGGEDAPVGGEQNGKENALTGGEHSGEHTVNPGEHTVNPGEHTVNPGESPAEIGDHKVDGDKQVVTPPDATHVEHSGAELHLGDLHVEETHGIVRPEAETHPAGEPHVMDEALQPIFSKSVELANKAVQQGNTTEDVINFFKYAAGEGQYVKANMADVAKQASDVGQTAMEAMIKRAYETTPETAALLDEGMSLAQAANKHGATPEEDLAFLQFAYGKGKDAEIPLRVAAEIAGDEALDHRLQEAYAGAKQLNRETPGLPRISLDGIHPDAANILINILGNLPEDASSHQLFRNNLNRWLDLVPDGHFPVKQYAQATSHGIVAAVVDGKLNTDYLSQFGDRSITNPDLLDRLKGMSHQSFAPVVEAGEPVKLTGPDTPTEETVQPPVADGTQQNVERAATNNPYKPAIDHQPGRKIVNAEQLIEEFQTTEGRAKQARAFMLSDFIGKMDANQFFDWYYHGLSEANRPGVPQGTVNFDLMSIPGVEVLKRPELINAYNDPEHALLDAATLKDFLSAPSKAKVSPPQWQTEYIADQIEKGTLKARMTPAPEGAEDQPLDPSKIIRDSVPMWFIKGMRDNASTHDRNTGAATYPADFDDNLAQMLENQRYIDKQSDRYRESTPPNNSFSDRVSLLQKALEVQQKSTAPELVPQILKLGTGDQLAVRGIFDKLDPATNAPEYTELLKIVVPRAENIQELKTLMDAIHFGKKADSAAFKAKKNGGSNPNAERDRDNNVALAQAAIDHIVPPGEPGNERARKIASDAITGRIRDPRPDTDESMGRGPRPGGKPGGGREFRQRRPEQGGGEQGGDNQGGPVQETKVVPPTVGEIRNDGTASTGTVGDGNGNGNGAVNEQSQLTVELPATAGGEGNVHKMVNADGRVVPVDLSQVDLTPVLTDAGALRKGEGDTAHVTGEVGGEQNGGASSQTVARQGEHHDPVDTERHDPVETEHHDQVETDRRAQADQTGTVVKGGSGDQQHVEENAGAEHQPRRGGRNQQEFDEEDDSGYQDRRRQSDKRGKGNGRDGRGRRERGGANSHRWNRDLDGDE